jgi:hypothetical protein
MQSELHSLRKEILKLKLIIGLIVVGTTIFMTWSFTSADKRILRSRGLIIEDERGKPFIMMGSPTSSDKHRKRKDPVQGIILLDSTGVDRLFIGKDSKLQIGGDLIDRNSSGWSFLINDTAGDERGGFGFADDEDRIGLGLDYGGKDGLEAIYLNASNDIAYILINGNVTKGARDRIVLWHDVKKDVSMIKLGDQTKDDRIVLKSKSGMTSLFYRDSLQNKIGISK